MFIRVTNAHPTMAGDPLIINVNSIVSVYENHVVGGSLMTTIYASDNLTWFVEESVEKVYTLINEALRKMK